MYISTQNSLLQPYKAKIVEWQPLQDWKFKVKYFDDEGFLWEKVVESSEIELEKGESL